MTDLQIDLIVSRILRGGVVISAAAVLAGGVWFLAESGGAPAYGHFAPVSGIRALAALPAPQVVILAGLLLLIATPVARVAFSLAAFAMERDWTYVGITAVVLAVLAYSIAAGL